MFSFESKVRPWTEDLSIFMASEFPDHFELFQGPIPTQIRRFKSKSNATKCDIVYIDSSQSEGLILEEAEEFKSMVSRTENLFVMDSHGVKSRNIWNKLIRKNIITEHFSCIFMEPEEGAQKRTHNSKGFFIGSFI